MGTGYSPAGAPRGAYPCDRVFTGFPPRSPIREGVDRDASAAPLVTTMPTTSLPYREPEPDVGTPRDT
eukprot:7030353-Pyramimonas_sp.AAC.1